MNILGVVKDPSQVLGSTSVSITITNTFGTKLIKMSMCKKKGLIKDLSGLNTHELHLK